MGLRDRRHQQSVKPLKSPTIVLFDEIFLWPELIKNVPWTLKCPFEPVWSTLSRLFSNHFPALKTGKRNISKTQNIQTDLIPVPHPLEIKHHLGFLTFYWHKQSSGISNGQYVLIAHTHKKSNYVFWGNWRTAYQHPDWISCLMLVWSMNLLRTQTFVHSSEITCKCQPLLRFIWQYKHSGKPRLHRMIASYTIHDSLWLRNNKQGKWGKGRSLFRVIGSQRRSEIQK